MGNIKITDNSKNVTAGGDYNEGSAVDNRVTIGQSVEQVSNENVHVSGPEKKASSWWTRYRMPVIIVALISAVSAIVVAYLRAHGVETHVPPP